MAPVAGSGRGSAPRAPWGNPPRGAEARARVRPPRRRIRRSRSMARFVMSSRRGSPGVSCVGVGRDARRRAAPSGNFPAIDRYRACWVTVTDEKKAWEKKRRGAGDGDADDVVPGRGERGCAARLRPGSSPLPVGCSTTCSPAIAAGGGERSGNRSVNRFQPVGGKTSPPVPHAHGRIRLPGGRPPGDASRRATRPPRASLDRRIGSARS